MIKSSTRQRDLRRKKPEKPVINQFNMKLNLTMTGKNNRACADLDVGDEVKIFRRRKPNEKERVRNWSENIYATETVEQREVKIIIDSRVMIGSIRDFN